MNVEKIMTRDVKACRESDTLNTAAQLMWENDCGCVPVIGLNGEGVVVGMITDRDICMAAYIQGKALFEIPVTSAMARKVVCCKPTDDVKQAEALMRANQIRRLPVVDGKGALQGIVSLNDIAHEAERERTGMRGRAEISDAELSQTFEAICQPRHRHDTLARSAS